MRDGTQPQITSRFMSAAPLTKALSDELNFCLLRFVATSGVALTIVDNPWFLQVFHMLSGGRFVPVGEDIFVFRFHLGVPATNAALAAWESVTVMLDGWTDRQGKSVVAVLAVTAQRNTHFLDVLDCSADSGAAAMTKGRRDLVAQPKYRHILDLRCQMHAFNLLYGSFFGHSVPKTIMRTAQQIVMFERASHKVGELVRQKAKEMGKKVTALKTSNKTRFTSGEASLSSIAELEECCRACT
ncbi:unnamed protein product [Phaeothamnion confervicola]